MSVKGREPLWMIPASDETPVVWWYSRIVKGKIHVTSGSSVNETFCGLKTKAKKTLRRIGGITCRRCRKLLGLGPWRKHA